jgi:hypothetical protein
VYPSRAPLTCGAGLVVLRPDGCWRRRRVLYFYFSIIMLTISCLIYGMLLCFIWSEKASDYVDTYWDILEEVLDGSMADPVALKEMMYANASAAGGICLGMIILNMICVHCCAVLMGYKYTARKTVMWINAFGFLIGLSVMIIAFMPSTQEVPAPPPLPCPPAPLVRQTVPPSTAA